MDMKNFGPPVFTPNQHDTVIADTPEPLAFPSPLAEKVWSLERRIEALEDTTLAIKAWEETVLSEKVVSVLKAGPNDSVLFTVPEGVDIDEIPLSVASRLKEKLGVREVFFVTHGVEMSVFVSQKE